MRKLFLATSAMLAMAACTQEEEMLEQPVAAAPEIVEVAAEADVASVTLSGVYTEFAESIDCATCTYTVPTNVAVVDGTALGIKPGSVVCIGAGRKAGEIEFVNMVGTEQAPITIGNCGGE